MKLIKWSKSRYHKFSSTFFQPLFMEVVIFQFFCVRPEIFENSNQDMCKSIRCKYEQNLRRKGMGLSEIWLI